MVVGLNGIKAPRDHLPHWTIILLLLRSELQTQFSITEMEQRRRLKTAASVSTTTLNDLPEDILRHIISFLPTTLDAVKTTLISQKWRGLWRFLTSLNFNIDTFPAHNSFIEQIIRFGSFVTQTLHLHLPSAPLRSFVIRYAYVSHRYAEFVNFWIQYAVSHGASFLDVDLNKENYLVVAAGDLEEEEDGNDCGAVVADEDYDSDGDENHELWYDFNFGVLGLSCVTNLKLRESKLLLPDMTMLDIGLQFGSIRSLFLDKVYMTDQVVSDLMSCCVNLEALELSRIHGIEDVKLRSFTLRELSLKHWDLGKSVEILAPKLSLLVMAAFEAEEYIFTDVSGLVEARITSIYYEDWSKVVRLLTQVQHLVVQNSWFELLLSEKLLSDSFRFPNLKVLQLRTGYSKCEILGLGALLECCPNLETLSLLTLTNWFEEEHIPKELLQRPKHFSLPCLKQVLVHNYMDTEEEQQVVALLKEQGAILQDIILSHGDESEVPRKSIKQPFGQLDYLIADMLESIFDKSSLRNS